MRDREYGEVIGTCEICKAEKVPVVKYKKQDQCDNCMNDMIPLRVEDFIYRSDGIEYAPMFTYGDASAILRGLKKIPTCKKSKKPSDAPKI